MSLLLTREEYEGIVDSRLVNLENTIAEFKDKRYVYDENTNLDVLAKVEKTAEELREAYRMLSDYDDEQIVREWEESNG